MSQNDLILQTLSGLGEEYTHIVDRLSDKESLTRIDLQASLLTYESKLEQLNNFANLSLSGFANTTKSEFQNSNSGRRRGQRGSRGSRGRGRNYRNNKPICHVCNKANHIATDCYYRFDRNYDQGDQNRKSQGYANSVHTTHIVTPEDVGNSAWYMDNGSTDHITHDQKQLEVLNCKHHGKTKLFLGNGNKIVVLKSGKASIPREKPLLMKDIIFAPEIEKNLLSV